MKSKMYHYIMEGRGETENHNEQFNETLVIVVLYIYIYIYIVCVCMCVCVYSTMYAYFYNVMWIQKRQFSSTDSIAHLNLSRSVFVKIFSIGTLYFLQKTTDNLGSI